MKKKILQKCGRGSFGRLVAWHNVFGISIEVYKTNTKIARYFALDGI